jgi:uncharacterized protein YbaR (Trm112 family)
MREERGLQSNTPEIIEVAYDLQTGNYIRAVSDPEYARLQTGRAQALAGAILSLCRPASILEAGVGEATTLSAVVREMGHADFDLCGFDLSWSRVAFARRWLAQKGLAKATLCTGDLLHIPFAENAVDVVFTSCAIESNRGREEPILRELYRVARRFVVLLEPAYELGGDEARKRMDSHGYCRNLTGTAKALGYPVLDHRLVPFPTNPLHPVALTVIRKEAAAPSPAERLACPRFKTPLQDLGGMLFSPEALSVYPVIGGIPCLRIENAILASKYAEVMKGA